MALGILEHGVAPAQRRQRRQRADPGHAVAEVVLGTVEGVAQRPPGALAKLGDLTFARLDQRDRRRQGRAGPQGVQAVLLALEQLLDEGAHPVAGPGDAAQLVGDVGHDQLGGVGRGGGADVGDEVEQRLVGLVADRGHHRRTEPEHRPDEGLVGERQQVLDRPAAAGHHDHVDAWVALEPVERLHHLARCAGALHGGVRHLEGDAGPAPSGVVEDVALRGAVGRGDQAHAGGQEGQRALALGGEEALGGQQLAAALEAGEQLAEADHPDLTGVEGEGAAVGVVGRLGMDHDPRALDHGRVEAVEEAARAGDRDGDVGDRVAQRHEDRAHARPAGDLRDLPLDPHRAEPVDPPVDRRGDLAHRRRRCG